MNLKKVIITWGVLDLCSVAWFIGSNFQQGKIPIYHDIINSLKTSAYVGLPTVQLLTLCSLIIFLSMIISGIYLAREKSNGAIISYFQFPFRVLAIVPPSIFFITWPIKQLFDPKSIAAISLFVGLVLASEALKLFTIVKWHREQRSHNKGVVQVAAENAAPHTP